MIVVKTTKTVPYVYEPYPRCKYGPDGAWVVVQDAAEEAALGPRWSDSPSHVPVTPHCADDAGNQLGVAARTDEAFGSTTLVCKACGRPFKRNRPWQRGCGSPSCRAAASRRRQNRRLMELFDQIAKALDRNDVEAARALLRETGP
jgi:hypothetical protein